MKVVEVDSKLLPPLKNDPGKTNWWERVGGLPELVTRVAKHLVSERGKTESTAIATAISQIRKVCATGRTFGGRVAVHPDTKAEYCKAAAEIEAKRAAAKGESAAKAVASDFEEIDAADAASLAFAAEQKLSAMAETLGPDWIMETLQEREVGPHKRKRLAKEGKAMPDGSFPMEHVSDVKNAIRSIGRAKKAKRSKLKELIGRRADALKVRHLLPKDWAVAEEISEEVILLNALIEVFSPALTPDVREELSEAFVIPPLGQLRSTVKANRAAEKAKSKSSSSSSTSSSTTHPRAPAGTPNGGQFIATGGSGKIITGIRKKLGVPQAGGAKTKTQVEQFQKNHGLTVDGIIGRQTATALLTNGKKKVAVGGINEKIQKRLQRRFG